MSLTSVPDFSLTRSRGSSATSTKSTTEDPVKRKKENSNKIGSSSKNSLSSLPKDDDLKGWGLVESSNDDLSYDSSKSKKKKNGREKQKKKKKKKNNVTDHVDEDTGTMDSYGHSQVDDDLITDDINDLTFEEDISDFDDQEVPSYLSSTQYNLSSKPITNDRAIITGRADAIKRENEERERKRKIEEQRRLEEVEKRLEEENKKERERTQQLRREEEKLEKERKEQRERERIENQKRENEREQELLNQRLREEEELTKLKAAEESQLIEEDEIESVNEFAEEFDDDIEEFLEEDVAEEFKDSFDSSSVTNVLNQGKSKVMDNLNQAFQKAESKPILGSDLESSLVNESISRPPVFVNVNLEAFEIALRDLSSSVKQQMALSEKRVLSDVSKENYDQLRMLYDESIAERKKLLQQIEELKGTIRETEEERKIMHSKERDLDDLMQLEVLKIKNEKELEINRIRLQLEQDIMTSINETKLSYQIQLQKTQLDMERMRDELEAKDSKHSKECEMLRMKHEKELENVIEKANNEVIIIQKQKDQEKLHLQQLFELEKNSLERRQRDVIEEHRKNIEQEYHMNMKYNKVEEELVSLIKRIEVNSQNIENFSQKVNADQIALLKNRELQLDEKEETLKTLQLHVDNQTSELEKERGRLNALFVNFENRMLSLQKSYEDERMRCQQEQNKLENIRVSLMAEHNAKIEEIYAVREKLDRERAEYLVEKQNFLKKTHDDRAQISLKQQELAAKEEANIQERAKLLRELTQAKSDIEVMKTRVEEGHALMEERKSLMENERKAIQEAKTLLQKERDIFKQSTDDLTQTAIRVQRDSEAISFLRQKIDKEKQEAQKLRDEAEVIRQESLAEKKRFSIMERNIESQKRLLEQERLDVIKVRKELQNEKSEISSKVDRIRSLESQITAQMRLAEYTNHVPAITMTATRTSNYSQPTIDQLSDVDEIDIQDRIEAISSENTNSMYASEILVPTSGGTSDVYHVEWEKERNRTNLNIKEQLWFLQSLGSTGQQQNQQYFAKPTAQPSLHFSTVAASNTSGTHMNTFSFIPLHQMDSTVAKSNFSPPHFSMPASSSDLPTSLSNTTIEKQSSTNTATGNNNNINNNVT